MWFISQSISVTLSRKQIHLLRERRGSLHKSKWITTPSASSLLSKETSTHNSFSAWLPQLVSNKREGVERRRGERERERKRDKSSEEGSQLFSGTTPQETHSRRCGPKWMRLASMEQMQRIVCLRQVSHETQHTPGTHQENVSRNIISLLMLRSHGNCNHLPI